MRKYLLGIFVPTGLLCLLSCCNAQTNPGQPAKIDRQPAVAGSFYPSDKTELLQMLTGYFKQASEVIGQQPLALIVPHAGYVYSGKTAAIGYAQIDRNASFKHIFIIGSSHTMFFNGASAYSIGDFLTPLGRVAVDTLAAWLVKKYSFISNDTRPHEREHCLEVQLPFLQYWLKKPFSIVPIIIGGESPETCKKLASALEPFFNSENLFIISSDFSHYPAYEASNYSDSIMANAILTNSSRTLLKAKASIESSNIPALETAMCGWTSILTLLDMSEKHPELAFRKILHTNSGDTKFGDKKRVVGYNTIALISNKPREIGRFNLSKEDKDQLLSIARTTLKEYIKNSKMPEIDKNGLSADLLAPAGAFVTLKENDELRGCIGNFAPSQALYSMVQAMAVAASTQDPRFNPVKISEIKQLKIEISVLSPMKKIKSIDEIELGKHGIYIVKGTRSGTFLPQVANETHWTKEEFLGHCARDKAGIGWDGWKDAEIYIYEALVFGEP